MDTSLTQAQNDLKEVQGNLIEIEELLSIEPNNEDYLQLKTDAMEAIELYTNTIAKLTKTDNYTNSISTVNINDSMDDKSIQQTQTPVLVTLVSNSPSSPLPSSPVSSQ